MCFNPLRGYPQKRKILYLPCYTLKWMGTWRKLIWHKLAKGWNFRVLEFPKCPSKYKSKVLCTLFVLNRMNRAHFPFSSPIIEFSINILSFTNCSNLVFSIEKKSNWTAIFRLLQIWWREAQVVCYRCDCGMGRGLESTEAFNVFFANLTV